MLSTVSSQLAINFYYPSGDSYLTDPLLTNLQVAGYISESIVDGPGLRFVLFLQGCPHACPGCHNPETHNPKGGRLLTGSDIWVEIKRNPLIRGITFTGGEPFMQAEALWPFAKFLRQQEYHLMAYTGYILESLRSPAQRAFLEQLDLLVDGPYIQAMRSLSLPFRGSSNQRILNADTWTLSNLNNFQ